MAFGVVSSGSGDLAWRAERRSFWRGSSTLMSSLAYELWERERVLRRLRELALLWLSTSMSETSDADSASMRREAASSLRWLRASSSTARRRPYGEIIAEMALSASHSEPCFFFVFSLSAWVASGTEIALRSWRLELPTRLGGSPDERAGDFFSTLVGFRSASRWNRIRSASF